MVTLGLPGGDVPQRKCPRCSDRFYTQVGLDAHIASGQHGRLVRHWATGHSGQYTPAGLARQQERGRTIAAENNARRRECSCGRVSTPAGLALHQTSSGHVGWVEITTGEAV